MYGICWVWPPPVAVANEGLGWDSLLKCNNPGGDCYWEGAIPEVYFHAHRINV